MGGPSPPMFKSLGRFGPLLSRLLRSGLGDERRLKLLLDRVPGHDALLDVTSGRQLELHIEQRLLENRAQSACTGLALEGLVSDRLERVVSEDELDAVEVEETLELLDERVARLGEDPDQVVARQLVDDRADGQPTDELRDQAVLDEVLRQHLLEELPGVLVVLRTNGGAETDALVPDPPLDDLVEIGERPAADEQDVCRVDREELLVRMLASPLRRYRGHRPLEDLEQRLLDSLARHVARDRRVVRLAGDLVDLVDVDDPALGLLHVVVGRLDQLQEDVLYVLADVAGLGQCGGVRDRERDVEDLGEGLCEQRLAAARRSEQEDVGLLQLE